MSRRWTEEDDIYLEYFIFSKDSKFEVAAEFLGRSLNATITRAAIIRKKREEYYICRKWTEEEDNYIKSNYKLWTYKLIAKRLNRSCKAVSDRACFLGLKKNNSLVALDGEIRKMADEGIYAVDIARKLQLDYETLRGYLRKHNISYQVMPQQESLEKARAKSPMNMYKFRW
ncbi:hypothetical protein V8K72_001974 [Listeria monocytogenes]|uniref:Uncharacterized protein n=1 Tax=Listeria seeligeri TaxID=1640 RepID=A0A7X0X1R4_LISSE|nr:hypothetical protein [Listeria seeligeri]EJM9908594.1 hypothetical protein [Listeria monocytogenes]EJM9933075.1 hypothetical protein [Listeria monocytogenes]MBC1486012.1 hypothetical protein [Listeria seeligeri]